MPKLKITCIYKIQNRINGKIYIGRTIDFSDRKRHHKNDLRKQKHDNGILQAAWNKYKEENFEFGIIEHIEVLNKTNKEIDQILEERETYWISFYESYKRDKGYNLYKTSGSRLGMPMSEETKERISIHHKQWYKEHPERKLFGKNNSCSKPIDYYDLNGKYVKTFESGGLAATEFKKRRNVISNAVKNGNRVTNLGYFRNAVNPKIEFLPKNELVNEPSILLQYNKYGEFVQEVKQTYNIKKQNKIYSRIEPLYKKVKYYFFTKTNNNYPKQIITPQIIENAKKWYRKFKQISKKPKKIKPNPCWVCQYDLNKNFIRSWKSCKEVMQTLNIKNVFAEKITYLPSNGFFWRKEEKPLTKKNSNV